MLLKNVGRLGMIAQADNSRAWQVEARVQGDPSDLKTSLGYVRL